MNCMSSNDYTMWIILSDSCQQNIFFYIIFYFAGCLKRDTDNIKSSNIFIHLYIFDIYFKHLSNKYAYVVRRYTSNFRGERTHISLR